MYHSGFIEFTFVNVICQVTSPAGKTLTLDWDRGRIFDKEVANLFLNLIKSNTTAK